MHTTCGDSKPAFVSAIQPWMRTPTERLILCSQKPGMHEVVLFLFDLKDVISKRVISLGEYIDWLQCCKLQLVEQKS